MLLDPDKPQQCLSVFLTSRRKFSFPNDPDANSHQLQVRRCCAFLSEPIDRNVKIQKHKAVTLPLSLLGIFKVSPNLAIL